MFAKVNSLGVWALDGYLVTVEVDVSGGLPQFSIVGLPDNAVKESSDRVRSALKNLGFKNPISRITVNLAPADTKKSGSVYDLPILLGLLSADEQIRVLPQDAAFLGELSLDGKIRPVSGVLPMALACENKGIAKLYLPRENAKEAAIAENLQVFALDDVKQLIDCLKGKTLIEPEKKTSMNNTGLEGLIPDFHDVHGQKEARRAMEIAAVGMHNIVLVGAPGAGKSMLAKRLPSILASMSRKQAIETSKVYSISGLLRHTESVLFSGRPFRAPHHSVSAAGLVGGGSIPKPGEISLAHNGVLFLDELPEFQRDVLETLRQPMEIGEVVVSRVAGSAVFPSRFMLVAAMNPCPCGYFGHPTRECRCTMPAIEKYLQRVSGPLLDRIDLHVEVRPVDYEDISSSEGGEKSGEILRRVKKAKKFQQTRKAGKEYLPNALLEGADLRESCPMEDSAGNMLKMAFDKMGLSARGYDRVLRVCRSIADLDESEVIKISHVSEAVQYRNLDRKYWFTK